MSDLDGMDAFTLVLDRLVDAENRAALNLQQFHEQNVRALQAQQSLNNALSALTLANREKTDLSAKNEKMNSVGIELLEAAREQKSPGITLIDAIKAAEKAFDEIPF